MATVRGSEVLQEWTVGYMPELSHLLRVPYLYLGRDLNTGLDCYGLLMEVFRLYGTPVRDYLPRGRVVGDAGRMAELLGWTETCPEFSDPPLAVLMSRTCGGHHAGVYIGGGRIIHIGETTGCVIERRAKLKRDIIGFYAWSEQ